MMHTMIMSTEVTPCCAEGCVASATHILQYDPSTRCWGVYEDAEPAYCAGHAWMRLGHLVTHIATRQAHLVEERRHA